MSDVTDRPSRRVVSLDSMTDEEREWLIAALEQSILELDTKEEDNETKTSKDS